MIGMLPQPDVTVAAAAGQVPSQIDAVVNAGEITVPDTLKPTEPVLGAPSVAPALVKVWVTPR